LTRPGHVARLCFTSMFLLGRMWSTDLRRHVTSGAKITAGMSQSSGLIDTMCFACVVQVLMAAGMMKSSGPDNTDARQWCLHGAVRSAARGLSDRLDLPQNAARCGSLLCQFSQHLVSRQPSILPSAPDDVRIHTTAPAQSNAVGSSEYGV
jgi:hypothetical protein